MKKLIFFTCILLYGIAAVFYACNKANDAVPVTHNEPGQVLSASNSSDISNGNKNDIVIARIDGNKVEMLMPETKLKKGITKLMDHILPEKAPIKVDIITVEIKGGTVFLLIRANTNRSEEFPTRIDLEELKNGEHPPVFALPWDPRVITCLPHCCSKCGLTGPVLDKCFCSGSGNHACNDRENEIRFCSNSALTAPPDMRELFN